MSMPLPNLGQALDALPGDPQVASTPWYKRWSRAHKFANASLASSRTLLVAEMWSPPQREGLLGMEFGGWRSKSCKVEQWYQAQLEHARQQNSTTRFTAIQHRSTLDAPFFHEFLLIPLAGGSFYRVERTGVGSNVEAIRHGCKARDLIRWFPADKYEAFTRDKPSKLIAEVQFPCEFDILHVLAVCYSIQRNYRTRNYTLQSYNCYFLCCAILSVLARHTSDWESLVSPNMWGELVNQTFDQLDRLSHSPLNPEAENNLALHVYSMLDPENPQPAEFLLSWLRDQVSKGDRFRKLLARSLWWSNYGPSVFEEFETIIPEELIRAAKLQRQKNEPSPCAAALLAALVQERSDSSSNILGSVKAIYDEERLTSAIRTKVHNSRELDTSLPRTTPIPLKLRFIFAMQAPIAAMYAPITAWNFAKGITNADEQFSGLPGVAKLRLRTRAFIGGLWSGSTMSEAESFAEAHLEGETGDYRGHLFIPLATDKSPLLRTLKRVKASDPKGLAEQCREIMSYDSENWEYCRKSLRLLLVETLSAVIKAKILNLTNHITLVRPGKSSSLLHDEVNIFDFQEHIGNHIKRYADRVDRHQLDSSVLVCQDVRGAILEIWMSMPPTDDSSAAKP
ncbi:hypothetical protein FRC10_005286 [Ceratobasidium sp. 414]|nr:hypothetical protein FRC10_005286 [Ceratobasidium sp. 414]